MTKIDNIKGEIVKDSRGRDTIAVTVCAGGYEGTFSVPSGASTGKKEVVSLVADDALRKLIEITPALIGCDIFSQKRLDEKLHELDDKTENLDHLGGNVALGISAANLKVAAENKGLETWQYLREMDTKKGDSESPLLVVNLINGGKHAVEGSPIQEYQIIPDTQDVHLAFTIAKAVQEKLREIAEESYGSELGIGDEGGLQIPSEDIETPLVLINNAIERSEIKTLVKMGVDVAASSFYEVDKYVLQGRSFSRDELLATYQDLCTKHKRLQWFEDPMAEDDWEGFDMFFRLGLSELTIGDDLTVTNTSLLKKAIDEKILNSLIIKPNQIGTITDTLATIDMAHRNNIKCIVSHRSGETKDTLIADIAYGLQCYAMKAGAPNAPFRQEKYDRLLEITAQS